MNKGSAYDRQSAPRCVFLFLLGGLLLQRRRPARKHSRSWAAASTRRPTPRRSPMRWLLRRTVSSPRSVPQRNQIPQDARVIDCAGKTIVAGFWNSHVHFTRRRVEKRRQRAGGVACRNTCRTMLTKWGFTTVWDLGSDPSDSLPLRKRVNSGDVAGPNILLCRQHFPKGWSSRLSAARAAASRSGHAG